MRSHTGLLSAVTLVLAALTATASADGPGLKEIMQAMRDNLIEITDGLLLDDLDRIAQGADALAEHPPIEPSQVRLVAEELGPDMSEFKQFDVQVHDVSLSIAAAARAGNSDAVWAD